MKVGVESSALEEKPFDHLESIPAMRKRLGWRLYAGTLVLMVAVSVPILYWWPDYYWSVLPASLAIASILLRFWVFSRRLWFWVTMAAMTILQIPLVIGVHDMANRYKGSLAFFFILIERASC